MPRRLVYLPAPVLEEEKVMFWKGFAIAISIAFVGLLFYSTVYPVVFSHETRIKAVEVQANQIADFLNKQIEQARQAKSPGGLTTPNTGK